MNLIEKAILEWSYRTKKGYPDLKNVEDLRVFESMFGFNPITTVNEAPNITFDELSPEAQAVGNELMDLLGVSQDQFKGSSANSFYVYVPSEDRPSMFDKVQNSGKFGSARKERSGNWKTDNGVIFSLKPTGEKAGEYFNLKPQQLGLTTDKEISLDQLESELIEGIEKNNVLTDIQKQYLKYAVSKKGSIENIPTDELSNGFFNEVFKNFGEPHGALEYGRQHGCDRVFFPKAGNYALIDYILYKGDERIQVSAKTAKGAGNTVKYKDVLGLVKLRGGEASETLSKFTKIIDSNSVVTGAFEVIDAFNITDYNLKDKVEEYKKQYPEYPKIGNRPEDRQAHADRISIEKELVKYLNSVPEFNFTELFNEYVVVRYVKYKLDVPTAEVQLSEITQGSFRVVHRSKNSAGHDSDKLGLQVLDSK